MNQSNYIALLDPSIINKERENSNNLGDLVIYESIKQLLKELFPQTEIVRISTHTTFGTFEKTIINQAYLTFVGGSNLLTSNIRHFNRFTPVKKKGFYLFPGFGNTILIGAGWSEYQKTPDWATKIYYKKILHKSYYQSVRDSYSATHLSKTGIKKIINTCCPSTWNLKPEFINSFQRSLNTVLYTVNGFHNNPEIDHRTIELIFKSEQRDIFFFGQTMLDFNYFTNLDIYKKNKHKFKIMNYDYQELIQLLNTIKLNYIGARLHGGIRCLQQNNPTLILGLDNRAFEIKKDTMLNVIAREDINAIQEWIEGKYIPPSLRLPNSNISSWKNQFQLHCKKT